MIEVHDKVFVGDGAACRPGCATLAVVHACKSPCHQQSVGYRGNLSPAHPNYLILRNPYDLFLNIIDPPVPLFKVETFNQFLLFAGEHHDRGVAVLVHCNQGESRAPTLALLFLAKHLKVIPDASFSDAKAAFTDLYPGYNPGAGIQQFLTKNWSTVGGSE
jgi:hypothetical protein